MLAAGAAYDLMMMNLFPLGWGHYLAGGLLIGLAVAWLFVSTGRIGGMSSVFTTTWSFVSGRAFFEQARFVQTRVWRLVYALGLILGAALWWLWRGHGVPMHTGVPAWQLLLGGGCWWAMALGVAAVVHRGMAYAAWLRCNGLRCWQCWCSW